MLKKIKEIILNKKILYDIEAVFLLFLPILITLDRYIPIVGTILTGIPFIIGILSIIIYQKKKRIKYLIIGILLVINAIITNAFEKQFEYIKPLIIFLTTLDMVQDIDFLKTIKKYFEKYYKFLVISVGIVLFANSIFAIFNFKEGISHYSETWKISAFQGLYQDPHQAAYRFCTLIIYIMFFIKLGRNNIINTIMLIISEALLLKTGARSPTLLGLALGMIAIYFMKDKILQIYREHKKVSIIAIIIITVGLVMYFPQTGFMKKNIESTNAAFKFDNGRSVLRDADINYFISNSIIDKLFGNSITEIHNVNFKAIHSYIWSHNDIVQILLQFGIIMLIIYLETLINSIIYQLEDQKKFDKFIIVLLNLVYFFVAFFNGLFFFPRFIVAIPVIFVIYKIYNLEKDEEKIAKEPKNTENLKILNLLSSGGTGGIETLFRDIVKNTTIDNRICVLFEEGEIYEELKNTTNNKVFSLVDKSKNKFKIVKALEEYCIKENIDIVAIQHGGISCNIIYSMLKNRLPSIKYVKYFHSSFDEFFPGRENFIKETITKTAMQKAINSSDLLVYISNAVKKTFEDNFKTTHKKQVVVYNGISNKFFEKQKEKEVKNNIIYVGRLKKVKGVDLLINAFEKVYEKEKNSKLTIVGDGEEKENLESLARNSKAKENIIFAGRQKDVIKWLDNSNIFIYPSIWEEGFGISVIEAMARGLIPITFKKGGLVEILENEKSGYLIENVNAEDLADTILKVINLSDEERKKIEKNAIETAKKFTIEKTIDDLKTAYLDLYKNIERKE